MARITKIEPISGSGLTEELSEEIFEQIAMFAGYGFNKSHAAAYAAISFKTAYLKTHHPVAFFAAAMNLDLDEVAKIAGFAAELKKRGIHLWAPSVNASGEVFRPVRLKKKTRGDGHALGYALSAIRGVGRSVAAEIVAEREAAGAFASVEDFMTRMGPRAGKTVLTALAKAGAFDCMGVSRAEALARVQGRTKAADVRQGSMFDLMDDAGPELDIEPLSRDAELDLEFDVLGHYMTGHPLDTLKPRLFDEGLYFSTFVLEGSTGQMRRARMAAVITDIDVRRTRSGDVMAVLTCSDPEGVYEALAFGEAWTEIAPSVSKKARLVVDAAVSVRGDERRLIVEHVGPIPAPKPERRAPKRKRQAVAA